MLRGTLRAGTLALRSILNEAAMEELRRLYKERKKFLRKQGVDYTGFGAIVIEANHWIVEDWVDRTTRDTDNNDRFYVGVFDHCTLLSLLDELWERCESINKEEIAKSFDHKDNYHVPTLVVKNDEVWTTYFSCKRRWVAIR